MCGIVGYVGKRQAYPILIKGLHRLEYRGYDSAGLALVNREGVLNVFKSKGKVADLEHFVESKDLDGTIGIAHTRWATHGEPNDINAHPHYSDSGNIALIHNGIIENYRVLKEALIENGYTFKSDTDTEVLVNLIEYIRTSNNCTLLEAVQQALKQVIGAYAIAVVEKGNQDQIIAARRSSPMVIGIGDKEFFLASDAASIVEYTDKIVYVNDGEVVVMDRNHPLKIVTLDNQESKIDIKKLQLSISQLEKGGYPHFMLKEIMEQPEAIRKTAFSRIHDNRIVFEDMKFTAEQIKDVSRIFIIACGSSYHVGVVGKYNLERLMRKPVEVCLASEFRYSDPLVDDKTLVIVISQSGETLDTMAALREAKARGAHILSIVNVVGSSIARESDDVLYTWAGPEIAVATTKAYSTQLVLLDMLGLYFADALGTVSAAQYDEIIEELLRLPGKMEQMLEDIEDIKHFASNYFNHNSVFFIGRNLDYAMGLEGSLKLKEISYIHSEAYASGELKHGTISLIEDGTLVIALGTYEPLFDKAMSNVVEVQARGADVLALTTDSNVAEMKKTVENVISVPETHTILQPSLGVVPLQLFAYYVALLRGCDIDKPRNLAKSVTVE